MARTCRMSTGGPRLNRLLKNREDQKRNAKNVKNDEKKKVSKARGENQTEPDVEVIDGMSDQKKLEIAQARTAMWKKALEKENTADMARTCRMSTGGPRPKRLLKNREDQKRNAKKDEKKNSKVSEAREAKLPETPVSHRGPTRFRRARRSVNQNTPIDTENDTNAEQQASCSQGTVGLALAQQNSIKVAVEEQPEIEVIDVVRRNRADMVGNPYENALMEAQNKFNRALELQRSFEFNTHVN